jgi:WD40 repeat protein
LTIAPAGHDKTVRIWDPTTGQNHRILTGQHVVRALAVAPDGAWLAVSDDTAVQVWDPSTGHHRHTLIGHTAPVSALAVAARGAWLVSTSSDGTVRLWDPSTGVCVVSLRTGQPLDQVVADEGYIVLTGGRGPYFLSASTNDSSEIPE